MGDAREPYVCTLTLSHSSGGRLATVVLLRRLIGQAKTSGALDQAHNFISLHQQTMALSNTKQICAHLVELEKHVPKTIPCIPYVVRCVCDLEIGRRTYHVKRLAARCRQGQ